MAMRKNERSSSLILDDFDIFCIIDIHQCKLDKTKCNTSHITRSFFKEDTRLDKINFVSGRLKNMERENIVIVKRDENNKKLLELDYKNVVLKKCKFPDNRFKDSVYIKNKEGKWTVFEI